MTVGSDKLLAAWLASIAPTGTAVAAGPIEDVPPFDEREAEAVIRAVPRRRNEFATARVLARRALAELGCPPVSIPVGSDRLPIWPDKYLGSISHSDWLCVAHVARKSELLGIGVDVERLGALSAHLIDDLTSREERDALWRGQTQQIDAGTLCLSAKEAVFKAYFPIARVFLDFTDVFLEVDWPRAAFVGLLTAHDKPSAGGRRRFEGRFARVGTHIATSVWIEH
jgi:4'-phosphopantetheinyl transferase EntD